MKQKEILLRNTKCRLKAKRDHFECTCFMSSKSRIISALRPYLNLQALSESISWRTCGISRYFGICVIKSSANSGSSHLIPASNQLCHPFQKQTNKHKNKLTNQQTHTSLVFISAQYLNFSHWAKVAYERRGIN